MLTVLPVSVKSPGGLFPVNILCGATFITGEILQGELFFGGEGGAIRAPTPAGCQLDDGGLTTVRPLVASVTS